MFASLVVSAAVGYAVGWFVGRKQTMRRYRQLFSRESEARASVFKQIFDSGVAVGRHERNIGDVHGPRRVHGFGASPRDDEPKPD